MQTILLLTISNIFMTIAWYGHLKYRNTPLFIVILISWGIAFFEYIFQARQTESGMVSLMGHSLKQSRRLLHL